jgi:hypothetical protein
MHPLLSTILGASSTHETASMLKESKFQEVKDVLKSDDSLLALIIVAKCEFGLGNF